MSARRRFFLISANSGAFASCSASSLRPTRRAFQHLRRVAVKPVVEVVEVLAAIGLCGLERLVGVQPLAERAAVIAPCLLDRRRAIACLDRRAQLGVSCLMCLERGREHISLRAIAAADLELEVAHQRA